MLANELLLKDGSCLYGTVHGLNVLTQSAGDMTLARRSGS